MTMKITLQTVKVGFVQKDGSIINADLPTIAEIDATFLQSWLHRKAAKTQLAYIGDIDKLYTFTGKSLQQLTLTDFQHFIDGLVQLKPSTQARTIATIKSALSFGVKTGYLTFNVGAVVKMPKLENKLAERILTESQIARMIALEANKRNHTILVLLYRAGLRAAELCDLQWRNLQERSQGGQVTIFGKGDKTRFIKLNQETWTEIHLLKSASSTPDSYVFQSRKSHKDLKGEKIKRLDESMIYRVVHQAARRSGIDLNVSPHWMRHAHATHARKRGAPIELVQQTLGHASIATTLRYDHVQPDTSSSDFIGI